MQVGLPKGVRLVAIACVLALTGCWEPPPSDAMLLEGFRENRVALEKIKARICLTSGRQHLMMQPAWSEPEVSGEARAFFYPLLRQVGAHGVLYDGNCSFLLPTWRFGRSASGGYAYGQVLPGDTRTVPVKSMDALPDGHGDASFYVRPAADGWSFYHVQWHQ